MDFWKEQPTAPISPRLRSVWAGGSFKVIDNVTDTVILEIDGKDDLIKALVSPESVVPGASITTGSVTPDKTAENWLPVGATITEEQKYSLLYYDSEEVALAGPNDQVIGVAYHDNQVDPPDPVPILEGLVRVIADAAISEGASLKAGWYGRVQAWRASATELGAGIAGGDDQITGASQPGDGLVQIAQATDQAADAGRPVTIVGTEPVTGNPISETINLDDTDTTTVVPGSVAFDDVTGVYFGAVDAAADIEIQRETDNAVICTIATGNNDVAAPFMATATNARCSKVHVVADVQADEWLTLYGLAPDYTEQMERLQLDDATPGKVTSTLDFRIVTRLITGELADGKTHTVTAVADDAADIVGKALEAATTDGDLFKAYIRPNAV